MIVEKRVTYVDEKTGIKVTHISPDLEKMTEEEKWQVAGEFYKRAEQFVLAQNAREEAKLKKLQGTTA